MRQWLRRIGIGVAVLAGLVMLALAAIDTDVGHRWIAGRIAALRPANGLRYSVGRIDGSIYRRMRITDLRIADLDGPMLAVPHAALDWRPWRWAANELAIDRLAVPQATLFHVPRTRPGDTKRPILPGFDIHIGRLAVDRLVLAPAVLGTARVARLAGRAEVRRGRALVMLDGGVAGTDRFHALLDAEPDRDRFDLDLTATGTPGGAIARAIGVRVPVALAVKGDGRWRQWRGTARARAGALRLADLALAAAAGRYTLSGQVAPASLLRGKLQRLTAPRVMVSGGATLIDRQLAGNLSLRSAALAVEATGALDLAGNAFDGVRVRARLLRPDQLFGNMTGRLALTATLDGAFATAAYRYAIAADRFAFGNTGFEGARAAGRGRLSPVPVLLPVRFTAARVTGVGEVAGGILRNLSVDGRLKIAPPFVTGQGLTLKSDRLAGDLRLMVDLRDGRFDIGIEGALARYYIPGIGIVDVASRLTVVPGPNNKGTRVLGKGSARVVRLDNAFFRSLAGGLPRIETDLERTPDGILHFANLRLTAPQISLSGRGIRRRDGTIQIEGVGRQATYGPVRLMLDGRIARPTVDLMLASPNQALGLTAVRAHLDPTAQGFDLRAAGGSRLGPFSAAGAILLPPSPAPAAIRIDALDVTGTRATGTLAVIDGGLAGRLGVAGGGWTGAIDLDGVGGVQRVRGGLDADRARLGGFSTMRRGHVGFTTLLDPAGARVEANWRGEGVRRGRLTLERFAGTASLIGQVGEIRASIAGTRGRAFAIQGVAAVDAAGYRVSAQGTLDRRPIRLLSPAVVTREAGGWRIAPTALSFAGGEAKIGASFGGTVQAVDATVTRMPLAILDIGYPGLGLGGTASGSLRMTASGDAAPTGRIDMTVRGLTRSGLVLSSRPVDVGVAGVLSADRLGVRAVAASGGQTIGRAQALVRLPTGSGTLADRIAAAPLVAQLRYAGPADALWRLTGVELFDLSGPVRIAADVGGRVDQPVLRGALQATGGRIESATTGTVLTNVQASGRFAGSRLAIERFAADAGRGGRVTGSGSFEFAAANGIGLDLAVQADKAVMIARDDIGATVTGPLRFRSDGQGGTISGDLVLDRSRYRLGQASAAGAVPRLRIREINVPGGREEDEAPVRPWTMALRARADNSVMVSGLGLTSEWSADLRIGGEPTNPAIEGLVRLVRGNYEFAGRDFALDRGVIRFAGEVPANPALDIVANADATGLNASIRVTGTALKPQIGFQSTPALPEDELLSRLLFGTSITNLSAPEALQLAAAVAALQDGGQGLNPINAVRRAAGLDRLRILPADAQTGQGTSIAAGKYVTRRLYAEIVTDGQGYSATRIEFQVTRWLSLLSSISTLGRQSGNVRVSRDY